MKIFVCCEGVSDVGPLTYFIKNTSGKVSLEVICETHSSIKSKKVRIYSKKLGKVYNDVEKFDRAAYIKKLYALAAIEDCVHIAYHQDSGRQGFRNVYNGVMSDFRANVPEKIKILAIVPKEMTESWLLSDEKSYPFIPDNPKLPASPEECWGDKNDTNSNYPKNLFKRVLKQFNLEPTRDVYAGIAEKINIETLKIRCRESFGQFYTDMQTFLDR
jgi:hypothetical protein